jgi:hypothetical protein
VYKKYRASELSKLIVQQVGLAKLKAKGVVDVGGGSGLLARAGGATRLCRAPSLTRGGRGRAAGEGVQRTQWIQRRDEWRQRCAVALSPEWCQQSATAREFYRSCVRQAGSAALT